MVVLAKPYLKEEPLIPDFTQNLILQKSEYGNSRQTSLLGVPFFLVEAKFVEAVGTSNL